MSFISYAQNFEDVMLWRAFEDVKDGFYIDVGANHPIIDSVTKAFYNRGWNGINVEPEKELYELLEEDRPNDINLNLAISASAKSIDFFVSSVRGWSTTDQTAVESLKEKESFAEKRTVKAMSLDQLCDQYNVKVVHFLKIDVEGAEKDVLESFSFQNIRPWIVVVEATKPTTQVDVSSTWEYILLTKEYELVYFDGLNKYYLSKEHSELLEKFHSPPNIFDEFKIAAHQDAEMKAHEWWTKANAAEARMNEAEAKANEAEAKANEAEAKANEAQARANEAAAKANEAVVKANEADASAHEAWKNYFSVVNSTSWKITKPLRLGGKAGRWFLVGGKAWLTFSPVSRPRRVLRELLISLKHRINADPKFKMRIMKVLNRFPKLKARLKRVGMMQSSMQAMYRIDAPEQLSPRAKKIYRDLKEAIEREKETV